MRCLGGAAGSPSGTLQQGTELGVQGGPGYLAQVLDGGEEGVSSDAPRARGLSQSGPGLGLTGRDRSWAAAPEFSHGGTCPSVSLHLCHAQGNT